MGRLRILLALIALQLGAAPALAQGCDTFSGLPVPRFVTLKFDEVRGRAGPTFGHPVRWRYLRAGLPVQVVAETADWRRVRDPDGEEVWMHRRTLSGRRAVRALEPSDLRARPDAEAALIATVEPGAVLWLERCRAGWCRLEAGGWRGWARAAGFWGVYVAEAEPSGALEGAGPACYRSPLEPAELAAEGAASSPAG